MLLAKILYVLCGQAVVALWLCGVVSIRMPNRGSKSRFQIFHVYVCEILAYFVFKYKILGNIKFVNYFFK
jgi:hypothetical protein